MYLFKCCDDGTSALFVCQINSSWAGLVLSPGGGTLFLSLDHRAVLSPQDEAAPGRLRTVGGLRLLHLSAGAEWRERAVEADAAGRLYPLHEDLGEGAEK